MAASATVGMKLSLSQPLRALSLRVAGNGQVGIRSIASMIWFIANKYHVCIQLARTTKNIIQYALDESSKNMLIWFIRCWCNASYILNRTLENMSKGLLCIALLLLYCFHHVSAALIFIPGVPVHWKTLLRAQVALNRWQRELDRNYGKASENPIRSYYNTVRVNRMMARISQELEIYNNVVIGEGNGLSGMKNLMIGENNHMRGNHNFVFSNNFDIDQTGKKEMNHRLVSDNWMGELDRTPEIPKNLHSVIYDWQLEEW